MAIFDLLEAEHDHIRDLVQVVISEQKKGEAFERLREQLEIHMDGEEEHVYPEMRAVGLKAQMLEAFEEHHGAKVILGELHDMSGTEEAWMPKFRVFAEQVKHHLREEEREIFPQARKMIGVERQEELEAECRQFTSVSAQAGTSPPRSESPFYRPV